MARNPKRPKTERTHTSKVGKNEVLVKRFINRRPHLFRAVVQGAFQLTAYFLSRYYQKDPSPYLISAGLIGLGVSEIVIDKVSSEQ